jgi:hypothetical protein
MHIHKAAIVYRVALQTLIQESVSNPDAGLSVAKVQHAKLQSPI